MSSPEELDFRLSTFLDSFDKDRARGDTMANLRLLIGGLSTRFDILATDVANVKARQRRHGIRLKALEQHAGIGDEELDTGQHELAELHAQLADAQRRADSGMWWKQKSISWAVAGVAGVGGISLTAMIGFIATHLH